MKLTVSNQWLTISIEENELPSRDETESDRWRRLLRGALLALEYHPNTVDDIIPDE